MEDVTAEAMERLNGRIVAVTASSGGDWFGFLKRLGAAIQPARYILEKIGLMGSPVVVAIDRGEEDQESDAFSLERLWRVQGVIRSEILQR